MNHFVDIKLIPDLEFSPVILMNALFSKFHRALVAFGYGEIGVSFPEHSRTLGSVLRLHGKQDDLIRLMELDWLRGLRDYTQVRELSPIPVECKYRIVKRIQPKNSASRFRRHAKRKGLDPASAERQAFVESNLQSIQFPFIQIKSQSSGQIFPLFIHHGEVLESFREGRFSAYGLSASATVPWF